MNFFHVLAQVLAKAIFFSEWTLFLKTRFYTGPSVFCTYNNASHRLSLYVDIYESRVAARKATLNLL